MLTAAPKTDGTAANARRRRSRSRIVVRNSQLSFDSVSLPQSKRTSRLIRAYTTVISM